MSTDLTALTAHQFFQGVCWLPTDALSAVPQSPPAMVQAKVEALYSILQTLKAPDSGWPAYKPQTPEYLLPYVADEVSELLEALQSTANAPPLPLDSTVAVPDSDLVPRLLGTLSTEWVWAIAASIPTAMTLLEGGPASSHDWPEASGVRLVPVLTIHTPKADYTLDLASQSLNSPTAEFAPSALIRLLDEVAAPVVSATAWKQRIQTRSIALAPCLRSWYAGRTVNLGLPNASWFSAQAQLGLRLVPLTLQTGPSWTATDDVSPRPETEGLPTARVWPADSDAVAKHDITAPWCASITDAAPWTLDTEVSFSHPEALAPAAQTMHKLDRQQLVMAYWQTTAEVTPMSLLDTVMQTPLSLDEEWSLTSTAGTSLSLAALCTQVKWLWIRTYQGQMALMSGLSARRLRSGHLWESGILTTQGHLVFLTNDCPIATLDVATATGAISETDLQEADLLQLADPPDDLPSMGPVSQFAQTVNQIVRSRSPLLASLMNGQPITLWSPHDELFPEVTSPGLQLRFQIELMFLASLP